MAMLSPRWSPISQSLFPWEREALDWLREQLPAFDPWHAWSSFEFIDDEGRVNEVDVLVLSPHALFLIEIKSRPGVLTGGNHTWIWNQAGRIYSDDNPLILANRKAKRLASLLRRQPAIVKGKHRLLWVEALVFLSPTSLICQLEDAAHIRVYQRGQPGSPKDPGIIGALTRPPGITPGEVGSATPTLTRAICRAIEQAGIRPSNKSRRIGDYQLGTLLREVEGYQDWEGTHVSVKAKRRIRIYSFAQGMSAQARADLVRAATREFQILEGIEHPGILKVLDFKEMDLGPALIFEHQPEAQRLDHYLREHGAALSVDVRLHLLRRLAEILKYAHGKHLYHRALCPQSILIRAPGVRLPSLQIMNWQTAARAGSSAVTTIRTAGTQHIEDYVEDPATVYLAPEAGYADLTPGPHLDVFSLGAIAYHLFAGQLPAASALELRSRLLASRGLRVSDVLDGAGKNLQDLIQLSTHPDVSHRIATVEEFLEYLDEVEDELTAPEREATVDPSIAKAGDRLEGGLTVVRRLGRGASSDALLVRRDGSDEELVLKVAIDANQNDRLLAEAEVLTKLRHPNIIEARGTLTLAGRTALLVKKAGEQTLVDLLREETPLSLDLIRRFGEELLEVTQYLEDQGYVHRDIKPNNIGISQVGAKGRKQLVLFDFSLSRTSPDNINARTRPYLDPFLSLRKPPRWDLNAERFAVAMTLYEMITRTLPTWGDGVSGPALLDCEVTLEPDRFDPHLREGLTRFFEKALRRDPRERYDNAEEMLRAWRRVFDEAPETRADEDEFHAIVRRATRETTIAELGYSIEAQNVLEGMGIHTVRELLAVDRIRFRYLKGVGDRIRKEIRLRAKELARLRPELVPGGVSVQSTDAEGRVTVDRLTELLLPKRPIGDDRPEDRVLALWLGLEAGDSSVLWPGLGAAARECELTRHAATQALLQARDRWLKLPPMTVVRDDVATILKGHGGVMTAEELARALLATRGSAEQAVDARLRLSAAIVRACVEAEANLAKPRYQVFGTESVPLIARDADLADYAVRLGQEADRLATLDLLASPQRALEALEAVPRPGSVQALATQRLLKLAVAISCNAALSSRSEIYPCSMLAVQALHLAMGSLIGPRLLTPAQIRDRILGRYPEAEPLPERPDLDALLAEAGLDLVWCDTIEGGPGYTRSGGILGSSTGTSALLQRVDTDTATVFEFTPEVAVARQFEARLEHAARHGTFLALTVAPRFMRAAEIELLHRFDLERCDFDVLLLRILQGQAQALRVDWPVVLRADAEDREGRDWHRLMQLVQRATPTVREQLLQAQKSVLLVNCGLIGRYGLEQSVLQPLIEAAGRPSGIPGLWLLLPMAVSGPPAIDGVVVPVTSTAQWARIPEAWIRNLHRAGTRPAA